MEEETGIVSTTLRKEAAFSAHEAKLDAQQKENAKKKHKKDVHDREILSLGEALLVDQEHELATTMEAEWAKQKEEEEHKRRWVSILARIKEAEEYKERLHTEHTFVSSLLTHIRFFTSHLTCMNACMLEGSQSYLVPVNVHWR